MARTLKKKPGQKLRSSCHKKTEKNREASEAEENNDDKEYLPTPSPKKTLNQTVEILGCSLLKSVSQCDKISYGKRKVSQVYAVSAEMIADALDISTDDITLNKSLSNVECCQKATERITLKNCFVSPASQKKVIQAAGKTKYYFSFEMLPSP